MKYIILFVSVLFFTSCKKSKDDTVEPQTTDLQITVVNELGERVINANVTLFRLKNDYAYSLNPVGLGTTDSKGQVIFKGLRAMNYYFYVEKDLANNDNTEYKTNAPITSYLLNTVTVLIE